MSESPLPQGRRKLLKSIALSGGAIAVAKTLPESWTKPVIESVMLPAHGVGTTGVQTTSVCNTAENCPHGCQLFYCGGLMIL